MPSVRQVVGVALGLVLLATGACTVSVCMAIGPHTEIIDSAVRMAEARPARIVTLPAWRGAQVDTVSATRVSLRQGSVDRISIREAGNELVLRAVRVVADEPDTPLPVLRINPESGHVATADLAAWEAAGPETIVCPGWWTTRSDLTVGDPWDPDVPRTSLPDAEPLDSLSAVSAGAHAVAASPSADGRSVAIVSGAGPRTRTQVILGGWESVEGPLYLEAIAHPGRARLAGPVALPPLEETVSMGWPTPCWSPSGRAVVLPFRPGPYAREPMRLAVLDLGSGT